MTKRIFSIILAMLMIVSLFSVASFAIEGPVITDYESGETVEPGDDTYSYKENGLHIYQSNLVLSGVCNERIIIDTRNVTLKDITVNNTILVDSDSVVTIFMENATIAGDVCGTGEILLRFYVDGEDNTVEGDVISDGTAGIDGESGSVLKTKKGISTQSGLMLDGLIIENMNGEYVPGETTGAFPYDGTQPITFTVKKRVAFIDPDEGDFIINNGEPFNCGEDFTVGFPTVYDENGVLLDPQPELIVDRYFEVETEGSEKFYNPLDEKPETAGRYAVTFSVPNSNPTYAGNSPFYEFTIGHNRRYVHTHEGKAATTSEAGYKTYYTCEYCEEYFEDRNCTIKIEDFDAWISEGGRGYIAKLKKNTDRDHDRNPREKDGTRRTIGNNKDYIDEDRIYSAGDADKNESNPDTGAPVMAGKLIAAGVLCACALVLAKKKHK